MGASNPLMREVTKQLTGIFLFCVMTIVVALETPALKYCLCDSSFVMSDCACEVELVTPENTCSSCCSDETVTAPDCKTEGDKEDCVLSFTMDLGEYYQGSNFEFSPLDTLVLLPPVDFLLVDHFVPEAVHHTRGSPESPPPLASVPLFVRHSVFLL